jgi:hypothetical protein
MSSASSPCSQQSKDHDGPVAVNGSPPADATATCAPSVSAVVCTPTSSAAAVVEPHKNGEQGASGGTRISKIKAALVLGYNGSRFNGLQRNPGQSTIEDVVEEAVCAVLFSKAFELSPPDVCGRYKVGGIAECNYRDFHKISWTRAARTDKGVHATGNVVSFKMLASCIELEDGSTVAPSPPPLCAALELINGAFDFNR